MPVVLAFVPIMIELAAMEVTVMFPFEAMMPVFVIDSVTDVSMPCGITIISIAGIISFKRNTYMYLGAGGLNGQRTGDDYSESK